MISVSSIKLLQIRDLARQDQNKKALNYVTKEDLKIVKTYYQLNNGTSMTIGTFLKYIAQMGGFLNRKGDRNPG